MECEPVVKLGDLSKHMKLNLLHWNLLELLKAVVHRRSKSSEKNSKIQRITPAIYKEPREETVPNKELRRTSFDVPLTHLSN